MNICRARVFLLPLSLIVVFTAGCSLFDMKSDRFGSKDVEVRGDSAQAARSKSTGDVRRRVMVLPFIDGTIRKSDANTLNARKALVQSLQRTDQVVLVQPSDFPRDLNRMRNE